MRFRLLLSIVILCVVVLVGHLFYYNSLRAASQEPKRWTAGDTLWFEIDSLPVLPSSANDDSLDFLLLMPSHSRQEMRVDFVPHSQQLPHITFDYSVPYWSVYRRSITIWGITFSTGQLSPFAPYPVAKSQEATVLSFPLQPPR